MDHHPHGKAENILEFKNGKAIIQEPLDVIFDHVDVKDRRIVAISTVGAPRKGKSLFLNYCLRYLYANYKSINFTANPLSNPTQWLGADNDPLIGFSWNAGSHRVTSGIAIWNDAFLHTTLSGNEIAIILLDTPGLEDQSLARDIEIFTASLAMSSMQIFYVDEYLSEKDLQMLQLAVDSVKFVSEEELSNDDDYKPFQQLNFIVRDWFNSEEFAFGSQQKSNNSQNYLKSVLKIAPSQHPVQSALRDNLRSSFAALKCDFLPFPGDVVSGADKTAVFDGSWGSMSEAFKHELTWVIEKLLKARNLVAKLKSGEYLTGLEFKNHALKFLRSLQSTELPSTDSIYEMIVEKQVHLIVSECVDNYKETCFKNQELIADEAQMPIFHEASKSKALVMFMDKKKLGSAEHERKFKEILEVLIEEAYNQWRNHFTLNARGINTEKAKTQQVIDEKKIIELKQAQNLNAIDENMKKIKKLKNDIRDEQEKFKNAQEIAQVRIEILTEKCAVAETQKKTEELRRRECETQRQIDKFKMNANSQRSMQRSFD